MIVKSEQNEYTPTGIISFRVNLAPTSQQAKRSVKDEFTKACKEATMKFPVVLYGEVKVDIEWYIHEQDRYETEAAPDVDNIRSHYSMACKGLAHYSLTTVKFKRSLAVGSTRQLTNNSSRSKSAIVLMIGSSGSLFSLCGV